jgi:tetratricopeptide (TPR) repeat protein
MDAGLAWTVAGSVAGVAGVVAAVVLGVLQLRQARAGGTHPLPGAASGGPMMGTGALLPPPLGLLPALVRGRADLIDQLAATSARPDGVVQVIAGMGGSGKSTAALELARLAVSAGQRVWWVSVVNAESLTAQLLGLAEALGAPASVVQEAHAGKLNPSDVLWDRLDREEGWVLVLDNADDLDVLMVGGRRAGDGSGWLRRAPGGLLLVTSRDGAPAGWGPLCAVHRLGPLDPGEGGQMLSDLAPGAGSAADAAELSGRLGGIPLALHQAGSYLAAPFASVTTFTAYAQVLDDRFGDLLGRGRDDRDKITSTWELSLQALAGHGLPWARELLRVLSCFASPVPVPAALLDTRILAQLSGGEAAAENGLAGLLAVGLIDLGDGSRRQAAVHPLVAETVRRQADDALGVAAETAVTLLTTAIRNLEYDRPQDWASWLDLLPHLRSLLALSAVLSSGSLTALAQAADFLSAALEWSGSYTAAMETAEFALEHVTRLGSDHQQALALRTERASAMRRLGRAAEAEAEFRQILEAEVRTLGEGHSSPMITRHAIGLSLLTQGRPAAAEHEFRDVLRYRTQANGPDDPATLATSHSIADALADQGKHADAEAQYRQVLQAALRVQGADHPNTLSTRDGIARALVAQGQHNQAEAEFREVLQARTRILGADHPDTLSTRVQLAGTLAAQGRIAEAQTDLQRIHDLQSRVLGARHWQTRQTRDMLNQLAARPGTEENQDCT